MTILLYSFPNLHKSPSKGLTTGHKSWAYQQNFKISDTFDQSSQNYAAKNLVLKIFYALFCLKKLNNTKSSFIEDVTKIIREKYQNNTA